MLKNKIKTNFDENIKITVHRIVSFLVVSNHCLKPDDRTRTGQLVN